MAPLTARAQLYCWPGAVLSHLLFDLRFGLEAKHTPSPIRSRWSIPKLTIHVSPRLYKHLAVRS
jgi:hypothetical protein